MNNYAQLLNNCQPFPNGDFETNLLPNTDCNDLGIDSVDQWFEYIINSSNPSVKNQECDPDLVCDGNYSIILDEGSGSGSGISVMTANPYFGENLNGVPQIITLDTKIIYGSNKSGIEISGTNVNPQNVPDLNAQRLGFNTQNQVGICQTKAIILNPEVSDYQFLIFGKGPYEGVHTGGASSVIDNVNQCGELYTITENCNSFTINFSDYLLDYQIDDILIKVKDSNGNFIDEELLTELDTINFDVSTHGTFQVDVSIGYFPSGFNTNGQPEFIDSTTFVTLDESDCCNPTSQNQSAYIRTVRSFTTEETIFNNGSGRSSYSNFTEDCMPYQNPNQMLLIVVRGSVGRYMAIWFDANNDGEFDISEMRYNGLKPNGPIVFDMQQDIIGTPWDHSEGELRIIYSSAPITGPCDDISDGEIEDYRICNEVVDPPCNNVAPENLRNDGVDWFAWNEVPRAISYEIVIMPNDSPPFCVCSPNGINLPNDIIISNVEGNSINLRDEIPEEFLKSGGCFKWKVRAMCGPNTYSPFSEDKCLTVYGTGNSIEESFAVAVTPNPNNGNMTFTLQHSINTNVTIEVRNFYGSLLTTFNKSVVANVPKTVQWNGAGIAPQGIYFVKFIANGATIQKTVIVE